MLELSALEAGLDEVRGAPKESGRVTLIVARPAVDERTILEEANFDLATGLVGDGWALRGSSSTPDGTAHPEKQITIMNARAAALVAGPVERWPLAGDQLYADFDLSATHIPPGTLLAIGTATVKVSAHPHRGCKKFAARFGLDALRFVNSPAGVALNLRGINTFVVEPGVVKPGDEIRALR